MLSERRGPKTWLTPEGELLYQLAQPLVEGMDRLHEVLERTFADRELEPCSQRPGDGAWEDALLG